MAMKIKYLMLVIKKIDYKTKINETKKTIADHNHDKYFACSVFND